MTWIKKHLALLVVVGALMDSAVFGVQGYQIQVLNHQQAQLTQQAAMQARSDEKGRCWAVILDKAITPPHLTEKQKAELVHQAKHCKALP